MRNFEMQHHHHHQQDSLSPEQLQMFVAGLSGLAPEEVRKAKSLYLRNALSEYRAMEDSLAAFGQVQGCMSVIPFFWPILGMQKKMLNTQRRLFQERIQNALDVWRDDLEGEVFELPWEEMRN